MCVLHVCERAEGGGGRAGGWGSLLERKRGKTKKKEREGAIIPGKGFYKPQDSHYTSLGFRLS